MAVQRKYERDIDLLLAEEFIVNGKFGDWVRAQTKFINQSAVVADVYVSKSNNLGESDLIVLYRREDNSRFAILIEDKVDAPLQFQQLERYISRADRDIVEGQYDDYAVLLCAPKNWDFGQPSINSVVRLYFEDIAEFLLTDDPSPRARYRSDFLVTAANKSRNKWVRQADASTDQFWAAAYEIAVREYPILEMKKPNVTKNSSWIEIRPADMPKSPKKIYISLKGTLGQTDLTFSDTKSAIFSEKIGHLVLPPMKIIPTGAASAISIDTPPFAIADGLEQGMLKIRKVFEAAQLLIKFYREHRCGLDQAAAQATPLGQPGVFGVGTI